jgi:alpha-L-glutamate ligase-like protein
MNRRNASFVLPCNPRDHYPRVDDKLLTKRICQDRGIAVPQTYGVIARQGDVRRFHDLIEDRPQFVIKPTRGSEGRGIMVIAERNGQTMTTSSGKCLSPADLRYHLSAVLAGLYSLSGQPDRAILEQRIVLHPAFGQVAVGGTPDVRVILYRGVPAMAMARFPTHSSGGRANLHQGALGAGVDLVAGTTFGGVCRSRAVDLHPDTGQPVAGLTIPHWDDLLEAAMSLGDALAMGYVGVDFVLDAQRGPVVLEGNARPGLSIQIANRAGLLNRLAYIDRQPPERLAPDRRRELIRELCEAD